LQVILRKCSDFILNNGTTQSGFKKNQLHLLQKTFIQINYNRITGNNRAHN